MSTRMGIQKRQWLLLFLVLSLPLLLNVVGIWLKIGTSGILQLIGGTYQPSNPNLPIASPLEILSGLLPAVLILGLTSWLLIFVSNRAFFQKQLLIVKISETLLTVLFIAKIFEIATGFFMPFAWLPQFGDYLLGLPISEFMLQWSRWLIFPATAIILFIAVYFSRNKNLESKKINKTVNPL